MSSPPRQRFCAQCGSELEVGAPYCPQCGARVASAPSRPQPDLQQPPYQQPFAQTPYGAPGIPVYETPAPFFQRAIDTLTRPHVGMARIARSPAVGGAAIVVLLLGAVLGLTLYMIFQKVTITFGANFMDDLPPGMTPSDLMDVFGVFSAISSVLAAFLQWLIYSVVLYVILAIVIGNKIEPWRRSFKVSATVVGWSILPQVLSSTIGLLYVVIALEPTTVTVDTFYQLSALMTLAYKFSILNYIDLGASIWSAVLIYFAVKEGLQREQSTAIIVMVVYMLIGIFL